MDEGDTLSPLSLASLPPLAFLDPNHLTRMAYVLHTAGDRSRTNQAIDPLALREVQTFQALQDRYNDPTTPEGIFLARVVAIVIGIAGDITRRKREYLEDIADADNEYDKAYSSLVQGNHWGIAVKAAYTVGKVILLGAIGLFISQTLAPYIPHSVARQTGTKAPSVLMTFTSLVIGGWIGYRITEFNRQTIESTRNWRKQELRLKYDRSRLLAFRQSWSELQQAWEHYTGQPYLETAFFELMIEDDLRQDTEYYRLLRLHQRSLMTVVLEAAKTTITTCTAWRRRRSLPHV